MKINICKAQIENALEISGLTNELGYEANEESSEEWLGYLLNSENHCVLIAVNEFNDVCGWVVVEKRISLETGFKAEITGLIVGKKYRRFGVGKKLVLEAILWAKTQNLKKLVVRSNIQREESHVFYREIGFTLTKTAHNYELGI